MGDVNFNGLIDRFAQQIYQSRKGRLRMHLIDALYRQYLPEAEMASMRVLDAGGGLGQMSHWFLTRGSSVDYFDISSAMVQTVATDFAESIAQGRLSVAERSITEAAYPPVYDLVNAHALLEWLEDPYDALATLMQSVKPGGYLGLMVYNKHLLMLRHLMRGTLKRAMSGDLGGDRGGLTPISPLDPTEVGDFLSAGGFQILCQAGVRTFSDLAEKTVLEWYGETDQFAAELALCEQRPYCDLGRYVLFIACRTS